MRPFTQEWADAFRVAVNDSETYRVAGAGWRWPLALALQPAPHLGYPDAVAMLLDLEHGQCRDSRILPAGDAAAPFVISGEYGAWKRILRGDLDPVMAIMRKELQLQGSLTTIMLHTRGAKALVACAAKVPTDFPDEARPDSP